LLYKACFNLPPCSNITYTVIDGYKISLSAAKVKTFIPQQATSITHLTNKVHHQLVAINITHVLVCGLCNQAEH